MLASCGFGSRRAMEEMILAGRITVNRMPAEVGQKVGPGDEVRINGELVKVRFAEPRARVLMYHKPAGEIVTRDDPEGRATVFDKLPSIGNGKWINVGRLDYNTEGLLLFTNSGELANRLMHPRYEVEREYAVRVMGRLTDEQMHALTSGIELEDGPARCDSVADGGGDEDGSNHWYRVVLKEGRNREVRRLFEALGIMVSRLIRVRYGKLAMPTRLKRGDLEELEANDVNAIVAAAGLRAAGQARPQQQERPGGRGGRHDARKGARPGAMRGPHPSGGASAGAHEGGRPHAHPSGPAPGSRPSGKRPGGPGHPKGKKGPRPVHDPQRAPFVAHARPGPDGPGERPARAARERHNFDEVQPQSNANAMPFGRTGPGASGGRPQGYGADAQPRHRGGPRAHNAAGQGFGKPQGPGRRPGGPGANGHPGQGGHPRRPQRPRGEVDGNVAPPGENPVHSDDDH
ncbi:MAG TPA: pseudouridine synthase [Casimicrobiaceae bacterium]|nr:pseudouridine synthase [Casimicrobiaceae bacterium]